MLTCKSCIIIPISFICRRKNKVVKMSKQLHDCTNTFLITRLFMFLDIICTYSECKSKLKRTVEKRRGGEVKVALLLLLFPSTCPHQGGAETGLCLSKTLRQMSTAWTWLEKPSSRATRQSLQASVLSHLDASTLIHKGEGNGLNTSLQ